MTSCIIKVGVFEYQNMTSCIIKVVVFEYQNMMSYIIKVGVFEYSEYDVMHYKGWCFRIFRI